MDLHWQWNVFLFGFQSLLGGIIWALVVQDETFFLIPTSWLMEDLNHSIDATSPFLYNITTGEISYCARHSTIHLSHRNLGDMPHILNTFLDVNG